MSDNNALLQKYYTSTERLKEEDAIHKVNNQIKRLSKNQIGADECKEDGLQFGINGFQMAEESGMGGYVCKFTFDKDRVLKQETTATLLHRHRDCILCKSDKKGGGQYLEPEDLHNLDNGLEGSDDVNKLSYCVRYLGEGGKMVKDIRSAIRFDNDALAYLAETMATSALRVLDESGHGLNRNYFACPCDVDGNKGKEYGVAILYVDLTGLLNSASTICYNEYWQYPFGPNCRPDLFKPVVFEWLDFDGATFPGRSKVVAVEREDSMGAQLSKEEIERRREERRAESFDIKVWQLFDYMQKTGFSPRSGEILQVYREKLEKLRIDTGLYDWYQLVTGTKKEVGSFFEELTDYEKDFLSDLGIPIKQPEVLQDDRRNKKRAGIEQLEAARKAEKAARKAARKAAKKDY